MAFLSSSGVDIGFREAFKAHRWVSVEPCPHSHLRDTVENYCACVIGPHRVVC